MRSHEEARMAATVAYESTRTQAPAAALPLRSLFTRVRLGPVLLV